MRHRQQSCHDKHAAVAVAATWKRYIPEFQCRLHDHNNLSDWVSFVAVVCFYWCLGRSIIRPIGQCLCIQKHNAKIFHARTWPPMCLHSATRTHWGPEHIHEPLDLGLVRKRVCTLAVFYSKYSPRTETAFLYMLNPVAVGATVYF